MPKKAVQFSVALDNTAGSLAGLCGVLRRAGANIEAISVSDNTDCGWVRLVATPAPKARAALARAGLTAGAQLVIVLDAPNRAGELERVAKKLAKAGVNINYVYGSNPRGTGSTLVLGVSDASAALDALG
jgi:hypothetical protein